MVRALTGGLGGDLTKAAILYRSADVGRRRSCWQKALLALGKASAGATGFLRACPTSYH